MKLFGSPKFDIYIRALDHVPPHCHVRYKDGSEVCVMIPLIEPMYGAAITFEVKRAIEDNLEILTETWELLHPVRCEKKVRKLIKKKKNDTLE